MEHPEVLDVQEVLPHSIYLLEKLGQETSWRDSSKLYKSINNWLQKLEGVWIQFLPFEKPDPIRIRIRLKNGDPDLQLCVFGSFHMVTRGPTETLRYIFLRAPGGPGNLKHCSPGRWMVVLTEQ